MKSPIFHELRIQSRIYFRILHFVKPYSGRLVIGMIASVVLLGWSLKTLPLGTAYAVWVGVGAVGTAALGIVLFGEAATAGRLASLALIVAGIVGLKLATPG